MESVKEIKVCTLSNACPAKCDYLKKIPELDLRLCNVNDYKGECDPYRVRAIVKITTEDEKP